MQPRDPNWRTVWQVHATTAARGGDLPPPPPPNAKSFDLPFGFSHRDRGIGNDTHDAIGIELRVRVESKPKPSFKRNRDDDDACQPRDHIRESLNHNPGKILKRNIREFWENRGTEGATVQKEATHLRTLLFRKKKYPCHTRQLDRWCF